MFKYTLVPEEFFSPDSARELLSQVVILEKSETVESIELPCYKAVLIYAGEESHARAVASMAEAAKALDRYNKLVVRLGEDMVDIVLAAGEKLLLCNSFPASDPVTAQYFLFAALRPFQINPEVTTVNFYGDVPESVKSDLFRHFASVEVL